MMIRKVPVTRAVRESAVAEEESGAGNGSDQIMARPDGYYWRDQDGKQEFGPFETRELALADMGMADEEAPVPGETLQEAEDEIGIADWIDPETGQPAEGQSPPRLEE